MMRQFYWIKIVFAFLLFIHKVSAQKFCYDSDEDKKIFHFLDPEDSFEYTKDTSLSGIERENINKYIIEKGGVELLSSLKYCRQMSPCCGSNEPWSHYRYYVLQINNDIRCILGVATDSTKNINKEYSFKTSFSKINYKLDS